MTEFVQFDLIIKDLGSNPLAKFAQNVDKHTGKINSQFKAVSGSFAATAKGLNGLNQQFKNLSGSAGTATKSIVDLDRKARALGGKSDSQLNRNLTKAVRQIDTLRTKFAQLNNMALRGPVPGKGGNMAPWLIGGAMGAKAMPGLGLAGMAATYAGPLAIIAGFVKAIKAGSQFESKLVDIAGILSTSETFTTKWFEELEKYIIEVGKKSKFTINQVGDAVRYMAMAGLDIPTITPALPAVTNIGAIGNLPIERAADIITNIQTGYGIQANRLIDVADILTGVFTRTNTTLEEQGESFAYAGNLASQYGIDFKEAAVAIGLMGNAGMKGSRAGTNLRQMLLRIAAPTEKARQVMEKYNFQFMRVGEDGKASLKPLLEIGRDIQKAGLNATELKDLFNIFGGQAFGAIFTQKDQASGKYLLETLTQQLNQVQGLSQKLADAKMKTFDGRVLEMQSRLEALAITFDKRVKPALRGFVEGIIKMVDYLNGPGFFIFRKMGQVFSVLSNVFYQVGKGLKNVFEFVRQHKAVFEPIINTALILTGVASTLSVGLWAVGGAFAFLRFAAWPVVLLFQGLWWLTSTLLIPAVVGLGKAFWFLTTSTPVGWIALAVVGLGMLYDKIEEVRYSVLSLWFQFMEIGSMVSDVFTGPGNWWENFKNLDITKRLMEADLQAMVFATSDESKISTFIDNQFSQLTDSIKGLTMVNGELKDAFKTPVPTSIGAAINPANPFPSGGKGEFKGIPYAAVDPLKTKSMPFWEAIHNALKPTDVVPDPTWKSVLQGPLGFTRSPQSSNMFDLDGNGGSEEYGAGEGSNDEFTISGPSPTGTVGMRGGVTITFQNLLVVENINENFMTDDGRNIKSEMAEALIEVVRDVELGLSN